MPDTTPRTPGLEEAYLALEEAWDRTDATLPREWLRERAAILVDDLAALLGAAPSGEPWGWVVERKNGSGEWEFYHLLRGSKPPHSAYTEQIAGLAPARAIPLYAGAAPAERDKAWRLEYERRLDDLRDAAIERGQRSVERSERLWNEALADYDAAERALNEWVLAAAPREQPEPLPPLEEYERHDRGDCVPSECPYCTPEPPAPRDPLTIRCGRCDRVIPGDHVFARCPYCPAPTGEAARLADRLDRRASEIRREIATAPHRIMVEMRWEFMEYTADELDAAARLLRGGQP